MRILLLRFRFPALVSAVVFLALPGRAEEFSREIEVKVDALAKEALTHHHAPGLSIAIALANKLVFQKGYGMADMENEVPVTAETRFRTASIAKPITAALALRLVETGQFDLDAPVQKYVPEFPEKAWPLTPRHLISHLGGVRHYGKPGESSGKDYYPTVRGALRVFADDPLTFEPGTRFLYTTFGYNLLGAAVESAGGGDFAKLLAQYVTTPAGMNDTVVDSQALVIPRRSRGYVMEGEKLRNAELHDTSMKIPGGGLLSTSGDLIRFAIALNTGKVLKPETLTGMWTRQHTTDGKQIEYGQGWRVSADEEKPRAVSHSGSQAGTSTLLVLHPGSGKAVAVMCNLEKVPPGPLVQAVFEALGPE